MAVIGCGALGTVAASSLVRAGVGRVKIVDRDYIRGDRGPQAPHGQGKGAPGPIDLRGRLGWYPVDSYELTIFPDGRAIVKGTTDEALARTLYAKYIGL